MTEQEKQELKELSTVLSVINNGVEYRTFDMTKLTSWIEAHEKKAVEEERERIVEEIKKLKIEKSYFFHPRQNEKIDEFNAKIASLTHLEDTK